MIHISMPSQPDGETCGPTALYAIYQHYHDSCKLEEVIQSVKRNLSGGTISAYLGVDALMRGYDVTIYTHNMTVFDLSWFSHARSDSQFLIKKLREQLEYKTTPELIEASEAYIQFLTLGGQIKFELLNRALFNRYFEQNIPILASLNATYLYQCSRLVFHNNQATSNDIEGFPCGHFVVLCGYNDKHKVMIADPNNENGISDEHHYPINMQRLINAILLGVLTQDGHLMIISPKREKHANNPRD